MTKRRTSKKTLSLGALSAVLALLAWGCGDNTEEQLRAAKLAQGCSINSDCAGDLVCVFERCHNACNADEDCLAPLRCVRGVEGGTNVCQLEDEIGCDRDKDCPGEQVCGVDEECRDSCREDDECIAGQICAASDECASTGPGKDELDENGNILVESVGSGGSAGAPAVGGTSGTGGSAANGGDGPSGGTGGTLGVAGEGAGEPSGSAGEASAGAGPGPVGDYVETSDGVEVVENDDREHALPASARSSLFFTVGDEDWLSVSAPNDGRAHVIEIGLQQEAGLRTGVQALAGADFASIGQVPTGVGVTTTVYVSVGPGTTTLLRFWPYNGISAAGGKRVEVTIDLSAEQDENEPNNSRETATVIQANSPVTAQFINPFVSKSNQLIEDWYAVELTAGTATLNLTEAPLGGRFSISRENEQGVSVVIQTPNAGVKGPWPFSVPADGIYLIRFGAHAGFAPFVEGLKPAYFSEPYTFEVQQ
ncbi:MAG: hypothetical protein K0R38_5924 [Polyangiaceae bacterium]|nr:hypothetical protein [Polyangiaceae bacterium]